MALYPQTWLQRGSEERTITVSPLTVDCPFCGESLGSVVAARLMPGSLCPCGARVVRMSDTEFAHTPPEVLAAAYSEVRRRVAEVVCGHDTTIARTALMAARHLHRGGRQRALLIGPSGSGKTTLATALADVLGCPALVWDVSVSSEVGWTGVSISDVLAEMYTTYDADLTWMSRGILVLDEIDKIGVQGAAGTAKEHRIGQMKSILGVLGGGAPVRFQKGGDRGRSMSVKTDDMLILGMGVFTGLPSDPGPGDLVRWGFTIEFASRFPVILTMGSLGVDRLVTILRREMRPAVAAAADFGYAIDVPDTVLRYVATAVADAGTTVTPRAGVGWLISAIDSALLRLLDLDARLGTRYELRPDDVRIPASHTQP